MTARRVLALFALVVVTFVARTASAHKPSDSYLTLTAESGGAIAGRWDIAIRDLSYALSVDDDGDGKVTWGELSAHHEAIAAYAASRLAIRGDGEACPLRVDPRGHAVASHSDGTYAVVRFEARCPKEPRSLIVDYSLLFDLDAQHRGLLRLEAGGSRTHVFSAKDHVATFDLTGSGRGQQLAVIVKAGIVHIWLGYDHVLFLLALLIPSVLRRDGKTWLPADGLRPTILDALRIVTSFTLAHSITLSLAALGIVTLPSRLVESAIAASVVLAAMNNLYPILREDRWAAAFLLGLMHGFGFSSTLMDLELPRENLLITLFGFNLGVEIGQVTIVAIFIPLAYAVRKTTAYRRGVLVAGSAIILALAMVWLIERAFVVKILS